MNLDCGQDRRNQIRCPLYVRLPHSRYKCRYIDDGESDLNTINPRPETGFAPVGTFCAFCVKDPHSFSLFSHVKALLLYIPQHLVDTVTSFCQFTRIQKRLRCGNLTGTAEKNCFKGIKNSQHQAITSFLCIREK